MRYVVWGYANSWIVNGIVGGSVVWSSSWMRSKAVAEGYAAGLRQCERAAA